VQTHGRPDGDTFLPAAADRLVPVRDLRPGSDRRREVRRCPACGTCYLFETDFEYLVGGSEDEQQLTRLSDAEAAELLG
jgi:hypothetical protein